MERDAVFGVFCRRWGVPLIDGGTIRLPRLIGRPGLDLILTGRPVGAEEALQIGLANRVVETGMARPAAERGTGRFPTMPVERPALGLRTGSSWEGLRMNSLETIQSGDLRFTQGRAGMEVLH